VADFLKIWFWVGQSLTTTFYVGTASVSIRWTASQFCTSIERWFHGFAHVQFLLSFERGLLNAIIIRIKKL
jgi:hypothetical protein